MFGVSANIDATGIAAAFADDPQASVDDISRSMKQFLMPLGMIGKDETVIPLGTNSGRQSWIPFEVSWGKNGWSIPEAQSAGFWAYNMDSSSLTTGTVLEYFAEHFGVWLRD